MLLAAVPATAAVPTERTISDAVEPRKAYDVTSVRIAAAPKGGRASIVVQHDRRVAVGDGIDVWIDTDGDREPDLYLTGYAFSEYALYKARGWDDHGRDLSDRGCASLKMARKKSVIRFDPSCLRASESFAVSVRSFAHDAPERTADHVPGVGLLTKRVLASAA